MDTTLAVARRTPPRLEDSLGTLKTLRELVLEEATRSPDPRTKVGCVILDKTRTYVLGKDHNRLPTGWEDPDSFDWRGNKYPYVVHGELAAVTDAVSSGFGGLIKDGVMAVSLHCCNECLKLAADCGIKTIVFYDNKYADRDFTKYAVEIAKKCDLTLIDETAD